MAKSSATKNRRPPVVSKPAEPELDTVTLDLEASYEETCRVLRIP